jgi:hypothetical protein
MAHSGRQRHRDRTPSHRQFDDDEPPPENRVFRMSDAQREEIAGSLRGIDEARRALQTQQNPANRQIIRELRASADRIFEVLTELEEIDR